MQKIKFVNNVLLLFVLLPVLLVSFIHTGILYLDYPSHFSQFNNAGIFTDIILILVAISYWVHISLKHK